MARWPGHMKRCLEILAGLEEFNGDQPKKMKSREAFKCGNSNHRLAGWVDIWMTPLNHFPRCLAVEWKTTGYDSWPQDTRWGCNRLEIQFLKPASKTSHIEQSPFVSTAMTATIEVHSLWIGPLWGKLWGWDEIRLWVLSLVQSKDAEKNCTHLVPWFPE